MPQEYLESLPKWVEHGIRIDGLDKLSFVIISWVDRSFSEAALAGLVELRKGGVERVALINQGLLDYHGYSINASYEGPFWKGEGRVRDKLQWWLDIYQAQFDWSFEVPEVCSVRLTRYPSVEGRPPNWVYLPAKKFRDACHSRGLSLHGFLRPNHPFF